MPAPKGNQFWKLRNKHGRDKLFASPELLWKAACEYFEWCDTTPLLEQKLFAYQGDIQKDVVTHMRPYTLTGLCFYLECSEAYFREFKSSTPKGGEDFLTVIEQIEQIIYNQKFEGAAAGFFNANIIARDLGLKDVQNHQHTGENGGPIPITGMVIRDVSSEDES